MAAAPTERSFDDWVWLYHDQALNADELKKFDAMIAGNPSFADRFLELSATQASLCEIERFELADTKDAFQKTGRTPAPAQRQPSRLARWPILDAVAAIAALVLVILVAAKLIFPTPDARRKTQSPGEDGGVPPRPISEQSSTSWSMYRGGLTLTGYSDASLPDKPELSWIFKTGGAIKGSPVIAGGRIFVGSEDGRLYCLSVDGGQKLWEFKAGGGIVSTPCVSDKTVFVGSLDHLLYAIDTESGMKKWSYQTEGEIKSSPTAIAGKILIGSYDFKLHCVDALTGQALWAFKTSNYINATPAVADKTIVFGGCDSILHMVDLDSQKEIQAINVKSPIAASAAFVDGVAYFGHYGNEVVAADVKQGKILWAYHDPDNAPFFSSPAVTKNKVVIGCRDKSVHCLDRSTGAELWKFPTRGAVDSSPVVAGDRLVVASDDGRVYSLSLADGSELWHYEIGSPVAGSPAVVEGSFLIGADDGNLYAFGVKKGEPAPSVKRLDLAGPVRGWRRNGTGIFPNSDPVTEWDEKKNVRWRTMVGASHSSPVVSGDRVFVTSEKSTLCCLDRKTGKAVWSKTHGIDDVPGEFKKSVQESLNGSPTAGFAVPTPICDGQNIFVVFGSGVIACYDMVGNCKWIRCIEPSGLTYGHTSSPLLADGKLIVSLAGYAALDVQSGKTIWENNEIEQAYGSPVLMKLGQGSVIITPTGYVVRPSDGKILARDIASGLSGDEFSISPIVQNDIVYYINRESSAVKLTLTAGQVSAKTLWTTDLEESAFASPVFHEGLIFACGKTGHYTVLDASNGSKLLEKVLQLAPAGGADQVLANAVVYPSLSIAGEKLFIGNDQGQTFVLKPAKDYVEVHRNRLPEGSGACPVVDGKDLFLRSGDYLYCIGR